MKLIINEALSGQRLDVVLSQSLKQSRSQVQKLVRLGLVTVNNRAIKSNYQVKIGDVLKTNSIKTKTTAVAVDSWPSIKVIKETSDYVVIDKPAGLLVHRANGKDESTLVDWLLKRYPKIKSVGEDKLRPGIVHRLDREVSGLMVIAKTKASFLSLKQQFQERSIVKEYQALVYGAIKNDSGVINFLLARATQGGKMAARPLNQVGKEAVTEYEVIKHFINYTYLKLIIKTGRTHQIRAHLSAFGHPLVGDNLYSTRLTRDKNKKLALGRVWLFASRLSFKDLSGQRQSFKLGLPLVLKKTLETVK